MISIVDEVRIYNEWFYSPKARKKNWEKAHKIGKRAAYLKPFLTEEGPELPECLRTMEELKDVYGKPCR